MENNFLEWVKKAEEDWKTCKILVAAEDAPFDPILFHCQQTAEKYLKACLVKHLGPLEKIHDLIKLLHEVEKFEAASSMLATDCKFLNDFAIMLRYPGDYEVHTREDVEQAIASCKRIRHFFRKTLGIARKTRNKKEKVKKTIN
ncbi:MAG: HEPN domain-containing protein [Chitinophagales bacterium]